MRRLTPSLLRARVLACALACAAATVFSVAPADARPTGMAQQTRRVEGRVLDPGGVPVAGAEVQLANGNSEGARAVTDEAGRFAVDVPNAAAARLVARARGFAPRELRLDPVTAGRDSPGLEIVLEPAPLSEEVTVTAATRTETRLSDTAASVVVLTESEIETTAALTLDDALRQAPGFQLFRRTGSRAANPTAQGVSLRGTGASGASRALVLVDGVPLNDPFGGWVYWSRVPRASIARVEVVRGGASGLYGGSALGGVVQIESRRVSEPPSLRLETSYGTQHTPEASLFASAARGAWGARVAGELSRTGGYVLVDESERGRVDTPAGARHATLDLTVERSFGESGRLFARGAYFAESRRNGTPLQTNRTRFRQLTAGGDWQTARAGSLSARVYAATQSYEQSFSAIAADRSGETLTRLQHVPSQVAGLTAQWTRALGATHTLVAGVEAREVRGASDETVFAAGRAASLVGAGGRERTLGLFAEDIFRAHERVFVTYGARFDRWRNYAAQSVARPLAATGAAAVTRFPDRGETAFSPHGSILYKPREAVSVSASVYRAFRQPTLNELYRAFRVGDVLTLANENLRAERLTGGEAGARFAPFGGRFAARANFFWLEITRPVSNVTLGVTPGLITRRRENLGRTRSRGIEAEAEARFRGGLNASAGYFFADATVTRFPANAALEGLRLPQVPRHQLTWQARYGGGTRRWTLAYQGRYSSAQFDDDQNLLGLGGFVVHDAFASLRAARDWEAFAAVENLFDRRYEVGRTPVLTVGAPRAARAGLRLRFGGR